MCADLVTLSARTRHTPVTLSRARSTHAGVPPPAAAAPPGRRGRARPDPAPGLRPDRCASRVRRLQTPVDAYIRVSRVGGREGERFISPALQRESIERVCQRENLNVVEWYEELD